MSITDPAIDFSKTVISKWKATPDERILDIVISELERRGIEVESVPDLITPALGELLFKEAKEYRNVVFDQMKETYELF